MGLTLKSLQTLPSLNEIVIRLPNSVHRLGDAPKGSLLRDCCKDGCCCPAGCDEDCCCKSGCRTGTCCCSNRARSAALPSWSWMSFYKPQPYSDLFDYLRDLLEHPVVSAGILLAKSRDTILATQGGFV